MQQKSPLQVMSAEQKNQPTNVLRISDDEWNWAEKFFAEHPDISYLSKREASVIRRLSALEPQTDIAPLTAKEILEVCAHRADLDMLLKDSTHPDLLSKEELSAITVGLKEAQNYHSFMRIGDEIFAIARGRVAEEGILGKGTDKLVKVGQNRRGETVAIEASNYKGSLSGEKRELEKSGKLLGTKITRPTRFGKKDEYGRDFNERTYLATTRYIGCDMLCFLYDKKPLTPDVALALMRRTARALRKHHTGAHRLHRDVKPSNILVGPKNKVSLLDFDRSTPQLDPNVNTYADKRSVGTPDYEAPELEAKDKDGNYHYSIASDIFALGKTFEDIIEATNFDDNNPKLKQELSALASSMTAKDPNERPTTDLVGSSLDKIVEKKYYIETTRPYLKSQQGSSMQWVQSDKEKFIRNLRRTLDKFYGDTEATTKPSNSDTSDKALTVLVQNVTDLYSSVRDLDKDGALLKNVIDYLPPTLGKKISTSTFIAEAWNLL